MKRVISAMLAVLICVLALGECEKVPTEQESGSESSFAESDEASVSEDEESNETRKPEMV